MVSRGSKLKETVGGLGESTEDVSSREVKRKERVEQCSKALFGEECKRKGDGSQTAEVV